MPYCEGFEEHLRQTSEQVSAGRDLEMLGEKPTGKKCVGMEGIVKKALRRWRKTTRAL